MAVALLKHFAVTTTNIWEKKKASEGILRLCRRCMNANVRGHITIRARSTLAGHFIGCEPIRQAKILSNKTKSNIKERSRSQKTIDMS